MENIIDEIFELFDTIVDDIIRLYNKIILKRKEGSGNYSLKELEAFYHDKRSNLDQIYISDIFELAKDDNWLEDNHRYIQWLFPLNEPSNFNLAAPVLTDTQVGYLKEDKTFQEILTKSFWLMMDFYGLGVDKNYPGTLCIVNKNKAYEHWLKSYDHNHLRISRILNCLDLFERNDLSDIFRFELKQEYEKYGKINTKTIGYWKLKTDKMVN